MNMTHAQYQEQLANLSDTSIVCKVPMNATVCLVDDYAVCVWSLRWHVRLAIMWQYESYSLLVNRVSLCDQPLTEPFTELKGVRWLSSEGVGLVIRRLPG